uniref:cDNA FLJ55877 n=1 Tax=Homo sapiens TaxID=9606 RepID=B4DIK9_HUMAN|nr:unnamed protein product [Homo sapiens]
MRVRGLGPPSTSPTYQTLPSHLPLPAHPLPTGLRGGAQRWGRGATLLSLRTERQGGELTPVPLRLAARSSWQRPPAGVQHLLPNRQRGGAGAALPWRAVPAAAEPAPLLHGGRQQEALSAHGYPPAPGIPTEATDGEPRSAQAAQPHVPPGLPVRHWLWETGNIRETGQTGRGHLCHSLQRAQQTDGEPCGPERDPAGARGGSALHCHPRGVSAEEPEARQYCDPA